MWRKLLVAVLLVVCVTRVVDALTEDQLPHVEALNEGDNVLLRRLHERTFFKKNWNHNNRGRPLMGGGSVGEHLRGFIGRVIKAVQAHHAAHGGPHGELPEGLTHALEACEFALDGIKKANAIVRNDALLVQELVALQPAHNARWEMNFLYEQGWKAKDFAPHVRQQMVAMYADVVASGVFVASDPHLMYAEQFVVSDDKCVETVQRLLAQAIGEGDFAEARVLLRLLCKTQRHTLDDLRLLPNLPLEGMDLCVDHVASLAESKRDDAEMRELAVQVADRMYSESLVITADLADFLIREQQLLTAEQFVLAMPALDVSEEEVVSAVLEARKKELAAPNSELYALIRKRVESEVFSDTQGHSIMWMMHVLANPIMRAMPITSDVLIAHALTRDIALPMQQELLTHAALAAQPELLRWLDEPVDSRDDAHGFGLRETLFLMMASKAEQDTTYAALVAPLLLRRASGLDSGDISHLQSVLKVDADQLPKTPRGLAEVIFAPSSTSGLSMFLATEKYVSADVELYPAVLRELFALAHVPSFDISKFHGGAMKLFTTLAVHEKRGADVVALLAPRFASASMELRDEMLSALALVAGHASADDVGRIMSTRPVPNRLGEFLLALFEGEDASDDVRERAHAELLTMLDEVPTCTSSNIEVDLLLLLHAHLNRPELMWLLRRASYVCDKPDDHFVHTVPYLHRIEAYESVTLSTLHRVLSDATRPKQLLSDLIDGLITTRFYKMPLNMQELLTMWAMHHATDPVQVSRLRRMLPDMAVPMRHDLVKEDDTLKDGFADVKQVFGDLRVRLKIDALLETNDVGAAHLLTPADLSYLLQEPEALDEDVRLALQTIKAKLLGGKWNHFDRKHPALTRDIPSSVFYDLPMSHRNMKSGVTALDLLEFVWRNKRRYKFYSYGNREDDTTVRIHRSRTMVSRRELAEKYTMMHPTFGTYHGFEVDARRKHAVFKLRTVRGRTAVPPLHAGRVQMLDSLSAKRLGMEAFLDVKHTRVVVREDTLTYIDSKARSNDDVVGLAWLHDAFDQNSPQQLVNHVQDLAPSAWMSVIKETQENPKGIVRKNGGVTKGEKVTRWCTSNPRIRTAPPMLDVHRIEAQEGGRISARRWMLKTRNPGGTYNSQVFTEGTDDTIVTVIARDRVLDVDVTLSAAEMDGMRADTVAAIEDGKLDRGTKLPPTSFLREYSSTRINLGQVKSLLTRGSTAPAKAIDFFLEQKVYQLFEAEVGVERLVDFSLRSTLSTTREGALNEGRGFFSNHLDTGDTTFSARDERGNRIVMRYAGDGSRSAIYEPAVDKTSDAPNPETYWTLGSDDGKWSQTYRMRFDSSTQGPIVEAFTRQKWTKEPVLTEYVLRARAFKEAMFVASDADNIVPLLKFLTRTSMRIARVATRTVTGAMLRIAPMLDGVVNPLAGASARYASTYVSAATKKVLSEENTKRLAERLTNKAHPRATAAMAGLAGLMVVMDTIALYEAIQVRDTEGVAAALANLALDFATALMTAARTAQMTNTITTATMSKCVAFGTSLALVGAAISVVLGVYQLTQGNIKGGLMSVGYGLGCAVSLMCGPVGWVIAAGLAVMQLVFDAQTHLHTTRIAHVRVNSSTIQKEAVLIEFTFVIAFGMTGLEADNAQLLRTAMRTPPSLTTLGLKA